MPRSPLQSPAGQEVLTVAEAAAELRVSPAVVYANVAAGRIPRLPLGGRIIRIPRAAFDRFKRGELGSAAEPRRRPMDEQREMIRGNRSIIQRRPASPPTLIPNPPYQPQAVESIVDTPNVRATPLS